MNFYVIANATNHGATKGYNRSCHVTADSIEQAIEKAEVKTDSNSYAAWEPVQVVRTCGPGGWTNPKYIVGI